MGSRARRGVLTAVFAVAIAAGCGDGTRADAGGDDARGNEAATADAGAMDTPAVDVAGMDAGGSDVAANDVPATDAPRPDAPPADVPPSDGGAMPAFFPPGTEWDRDVSAAAVDPESATVISWLAANGGWGLGRMQIDFSIEVLRADASAPFRMFTRTGDWFATACDYEPVPIPAGGALEGETGYECVSDGDCHLIVVHEPTRRLFEMWRANITSAGFNGGCLAVWDLNRRYGPLGRGDQCTSADAAGFPIAPLLFTADEVAAGEIRHAIRFILPNPRMRRGFYVRPATHAGAPSGPMQAPPYGARFRLRADYPLARLPNNGARVVARALQRYGMLLADGGSVALTARSDRSTRARWAGLLGPRDLDMLQVSDFQMVDAGPRVALTRNCVRTP